MSLKFLSKSVELGRATHVLPVGVTELQLSHSLLHSVADMMGQFTDMLRSVPIDAQRLRLSITVSASGEPPTNESSISTTQPGNSSPTNPSPQGSFQSLSEASFMEMGEAALRKYHPTLAEEELGPASPTPPFSKHMFEGVLTENCIHCNMPLSATQHPRMYTHAGIVFNYDEYGRSR
jgi:hypothetical protein